MSAQQTHKKHAGLNRWRGTVADLAELARVVEDLVSEQAATPPSFYIFVERPGFESTFDSVAAFADGLADADLSDVSRVFILATDYLGNGSAASVNMSRKYGVSAEVKGPSPTWVTGGGERLSGTGG